MFRTGPALLCFAFASLSVFQTGCASSPANEAPCFDGWSIDQSGASRVLTPDAAQTAALLAINPSDEKAVCYHVMPSGEVIVITTGAGPLHAYRARPSKDGYELGGKETIVRFD